jgi:hypothetical protein
MWPFKSQRREQERLLIAYREAVAEFLEWGEDWAKAAAHRQRKDGFSPVGQYDGIAKAMLHFDSHFAEIEPEHYPGLHPMIDDAKQAA